MHLESVYGAESGRGTRSLRPNTQPQTNLDQTPIRHRHLPLFFFRGHFRQGKRCKEKRKPKRRACRTPMAACVALRVRSRTSKGCSAWKEKKRSDRWIEPRLRSCCTSFFFPLFHPNRAAVLFFSLFYFFPFSTFFRSSAFFLPPYLFFFSFLSDKILEPHSMAERKTRRQKPLFSGSQKKSRFAPGSKERNWDRALLLPVCRLHRGRLLLLISQCHSLVIHESLRRSLFGESAVRKSPQQILKKSALRVGHIL